MKRLGFIVLIVATIFFTAFFARESRPANLIQVHSTPTPTPTPETWWQKLLRISGLSATPRAQRSPANKGPDVGDIWIKGLVGPIGATRIAAGSYRTPIFLARDESILALKGDTVVQRPVSGGAERSFPNVAGITRLVGASQDDPNKILVVMENSKPISLGVLFLNDNSVTPIAYETESQEGKTMFARLLGWDRVYCNTEVYVEVQCDKDPLGNCKKDKNDQIKTWTDVMVKHAYKSPINVSNCKPLNCGQPGLSLDGNFVAYVKQAPH